MAKKSKKSDVPRDLERAGALCLAFANTGVPRRDDRRKDPKAPPQVPLERYGELVTWGQRMGILNGAEGERLHRVAAERPQDAATARGRAVKLRTAIVRIFTKLALDKEPRAEDLAIMNGCLRLRVAVPSVNGFRWDWTGDDGALDRPLWAVAQSAGELLASDRQRKVRQCATRGCYRLFVYVNSRRRWCDDAICGSRSRGRRLHETRRQAKAQLQAMSPEQRRRREIAHLKRLRMKEKALAELRQSKARATDSAAESDPSDLGLPKP